MARHLCDVARKIQNGLSLQDVDVGRSPPLVRQRHFPRPGAGVDGAARPGAQPEGDAHVKSHIASAVVDQAQILCDQFLPDAPTKLIAKSNALPVSRLTNYLEALVESAAKCKALRADRETDYLAVNRAIEGNNARASQRQSVRNSMSIKHRATEENDTATRTRQGVPFFPRRYLNSMKEMFCRQLGRLTSQCSAEKSPRLGGSYADPRLFRHFTERARLQG